MEVVFNTVLDAVKVLTINYFTAFFRNPNPIKESR